MLRKTTIPALTMVSVDVDHDAGTDNGAAGTQLPPVGMDILNSSNSAPCVQDAASADKGKC